MPRTHLSNDALCRLIRNGLSCRISPWLVIAILLLRALIPANVMIDMDAAKHGHVALTLCSGHGPMFPRVAPSGPDLTSSHMQHGMGSAVSAAHPGPAGDDPMPADSGFCPFSSTLVVAYLALAFCIALLARRPARHFRKPRSRCPPWRPSLHARPQTRAPPSFCQHSSDIRIRFQRVMRNRLFLRKRRYEKQTAIDV